MIRSIAEQPVRIRSMGHDDLPMVSDIERRSYEFPWSHGVFRDCLLAGYCCMVLERNNRVAGYGILSIAAAGTYVVVASVLAARGGRAPAAGTLVPAAPAIDRSAAWRAGF